jgi:hypothetical protein
LGEPGIREHDSEPQGVGSAILLDDFDPPVRLRSFKQKLTLRFAQQEIIGRVRMSACLKR